MEKAAAKKTVPVEEKKTDGKKKESASLKKADPKPAGSPKSKKASGKPTPMFSKKTVASPVFRSPAVTVAVKASAKKK
jgi:hypothetical protein